MSILEEATKEAAEKGCLPKGLSEFTCLRRNVVATSEERENMQSDPKDADNLHCRLREKGFSRKSIFVCRSCGITNFYQLVELWIYGGVSALEEKLCSTNHVPRGGTVKETIIKLAFSSIDIAEKLNEHIKKLIAEDAKYSEVRFWKAFRTVLRFLPEKKYVKLKKDELKRFSESYRYAVESILKERHLECGTIIPEEDYLEVVCPECEYATSFPFSEIYSTTCRACDIKRIAEEKGFDMYTREECEDESFVEEMDETDYAFVCMLCQSVCLITSVDHVGVYEDVKSLKCKDCTGEKYLMWLAEKAGWALEIEEAVIRLKDPKEGWIKVEKEDLRPEKILESIALFKELEEMEKTIEG